jgi:small-conductance mechanosensitive channel
MPIEEAIAWFEENVAAWVQTLREPLFWWQVGLLVLSAALAWFLSRRWRNLNRRLIDDPAASHMRRSFLAGLNRVVFPVLLMAGVGIAAAAMTALGFPPALLTVINTLILAFFVIRLAIHILDTTFRPGPMLRAWESTLTALLWVAVALYLLGWMDDVQSGLDRVAMTIGENRVSLLSLLQITVAMASFLLLATFLSRIIQRRIMRADYMTVSMRIGVSKVAKFSLFTIAVLVALNAVGINLTTLTVLSGAIGVGIGFGLQRIIANFISGFVLIADRSIKQGDVITVGQSFGVVEELAARYVVVRDRDGVETLIPNENLMTNEVINWSHTDRKVRLKLPVSISYGDDPEEAMALLVKAAEASDRVLDDPEPVARLMAFGDDGIELQLRVWIQDPQEGINNVRSDVNLAIWRAFKAAGITIPFPQRDVHLHQKDA